MEQHIEYYLEKGWVIIDEDCDDDWNKLTLIQNEETGDIKYFINDFEV